MIYLINGGIKIMDKLSCKECICFPSCISKFKEKNDKIYKYTGGYTIMHIINDCHILDDITYNDLFSKKRRNFIKFYEKMLGRKSKL